MKTNLLEKKFKLSITSFSIPKPRLLPFDRSLQVVSTVSIWTLTCITMCCYGAFNFHNFSWKFLTLVSIKFVSKNSNLKSSVNLYGLIHN
jgi:hypothetical protein